MKFKKALILILALVAVVALAAAVSACSSSVNVDGLTCVTYELEGGTYKNSLLPVKHYYNLKGGKSVHLVDPNEVSSSNKVERSGYTFDGWFRAKNADNTYSDPWNFKEDELHEDDEITLYAGWTKNNTYYYVLYYIDETTGEEVELDRQTAREGDTIQSKSFKNERTGYTFLGYTDKDGNPWDKEFRHPGGEDGTIVKIYGKYMEGEFVLVDNSNKNKLSSDANIYLTEDINFNGSEFEGFSSSPYSHRFEGNNYTIKNFIYKSSRDFVNKKLEVSLFGDLDGATIRNVKFTGVEFEIYARMDGLEELEIAPIAINAQNSKLENVEFEGVYNITRIHDEVNQNKKITTDKLIAHEGQNVEVTGEELSFGKKGAEIAAAAYVFTTNTYSKKEHLYEV